MVLLGRKYVPHWDKIRRSTGVRGYIPAGAKELTQKSAEPEVGNGSAIPHRCRSQAGWTITALQYGLGLGEKYEIARPVYTGSGLSGTASGG